MNLGCLCRRHHRLKTFDKWRITTDEHAVFTFTAPGGTTAVTHPYGLAARIGLAQTLHGPAEEEDSATDAPDQLSPEDAAYVHAVWGEAGPWPENGGIDPTPTAKQEAQWSAEDLARARADGWCEPDGLAA